MERSKRNIIIDNNDRLYSFSDNKIQTNVRFDYISTVIDFKYEKLWKEAKEIYDILLKIKEYYKNN